MRAASLNAAGGPADWAGRLTTPAAQRGSAGDCQDRSSGTNRLINPRSGGGDTSETLGLNRMGGEGQGTRLKVSSDDGARCCSATVVTNSLPVMAKRTRAPDLLFVVAQW